MKVLMLGWELPPHNSGGLGVACYQICKHLARRNVELDFIVPYQPTEQPGFMHVRGAIPITPEQFQLAGGAYDSYCYSCESATCDHTQPTDMIGLQQRYTKYIEQLVNEQHYDAIHAHDWLTFMAGMRAKELTGKPFIAHIHATEFDRAGMHRGNELVHQIEHSALMMADVIIAVSEFTKQLIVEKYGIPANKIEVVHNAIDLDEFGASDPSNTYIYLQKMKELGYKVVVSLGRLSLQKGITHLLAAARRVVEQNDKVLFLVVGDGESRNEIIETAAELGIAEHVIFTGFLRGKRWRDSYAIGDMFVMPSISEPFGLSALEAAAYGNAVLLSRQCGVGEVLKNAMQFDVWDTDKLANAIVSIAEHSSMQDALAGNAYDEVTRLTWDKAVQEFEHLYRKHAQLLGAAA